VPKIRIQTSIALIVLAVGVPLAAILGIHMYMSTTARPLHQDLQSVPSVTHVSPSQEWTDAVVQGRQVVLGELTGQNLPGLSVAVGVGGELAWAEGFGWADLENLVPVAPQMRFRN